MSRKCPHGQAPVPALRAVNSESSEVCVVRHDWGRPALLAFVLAVLVWSGIDPRDRFTWFLEVAPVLIAVPILMITANRFRWTSLAYGLMTVHAVILMVGGHYTYAEVPLGFWIQNALDLSRNHYDRIGHFAQGFVPAILIREVLLRRSPLAGSRWLGFLTVSVALAFSASYELIEWLTAETSGSAADAFLGTQGDVWDTQWDMFLALLGAITALATLGRIHRRQVTAMTLAVPTL